MGLGDLKSPHTHTVIVIKSHGISAICHNYLPAPLLLAGPRVSVAMGQRGVVVRPGRWQRGSGSAVLRGGGGSARSGRQCGGVATTTLAVLPRESEDAIVVRTLDVVHKVSPAVLWGHHTLQVRTGVGTGQGVRTRIVRTRIVRTGQGVRERISS